MTQVTNECMQLSQGIEEWLSLRREAGKLINPETAEVTWTYIRTLDPYGIDSDLPEELWDIGRQYFARAPGSDIWVSFYHLPDATRETLWKRMDGGEFDSSSDWDFFEELFGKTRRTEWQP
jgi:hypothetical protein